jgi:hypothetical protein
MRGGLLSTLVDAAKSASITVSTASRTRAITTCSSGWHGTAHQILRMSRLLTSSKVVPAPSRLARDRRTGRELAQIGRRDMVVAIYAASLRIIEGS